MFSCDISINFSSHLLTAVYFVFRSQVDNANNQLDNLATKLVKVEREILPQQEQIQQEIDGECVIELMESVSDVTNDYVALRRDLNEMQMAQREMNANLRNQMRVMTQTFALLKQKIEANNLQPHLKKEFARNSKLMRREKSALSLPSRHHSTSTLFRD